MPSAPERVLDAPGILDDFYLNVLAWSPANVLAVGLGDTAYAWAADSGDVAPLATAPEGSTIASVAFSGDGAFLGVGLGTGAVELWDVAAQKRLRVMGGHQAQVASLSWSGHVLSSGCHDGSIWHHDVRVGRHKVAELLGHAGEVCGLTWRGDGALLASGGNDNVVNMWDARLVQDEDGARGVAKWTKRNHTAAVKVRAYILPSTQYSSCAGARVVPVAARAARERRGHERRRDPHLEQHDGRARAHAGHARAGDRARVGAGPEGAAEHARVPDQRAHGARVPVARARRRGPRRARSEDLVCRARPRRGCGVHGRGGREPQVLARVGRPGRGGGREGREAARGRGQDGRGRARYPVDGSCVYVFSGMGVGVTRV
jgi:hypothetical protein